MSGNQSAAKLDISPRTRCEDVRPRMAKAELEDRTIREKREAYGQLLKRASQLAGLDQQQTADELKVDRAQVSRWWAATENPQTWRYRAHPKLKVAYLKAQAEHEPAVRMRTVIEIQENA